MRKLSITNKPYLIDYKEKIIIENDYSMEEEFDPKKVIFPILIKYYIYMPHICIHSVQNPTLGVDSIMETYHMDEKTFGFSLYHNPKMLDTVTNTVRRIEHFLEELNTKYCLNIDVEVTKLNIGILFNSFFGRREDIKVINKKSMTIIPQEYIERNRDDNR